MLDFPYILKVGSGNSDLVKVLHLWLDWCGFPAPKNFAKWIDLGGKFTEDTKQTVIKYQLMRKITPADGIVRAGMWSELGKEIGFKVLDRTMYNCIYENKCDFDAREYEFIKRIGYAGNNLSSGIRIYGPWFLKMYFQEFGGIDIKTVDALIQFLDFMRSDKNLIDVRYAAYMMGTVFHETKRTWLPVEEENGAKQIYGNIRTVKCNGVEYQNRYYGRGYIQLTIWGDNNNDGGVYKIIGEKLGMGCSLVANPNLVLDPKISYRILSDGMTNGWFQKNQTLSKYISGSLCDYYNARNIVNSRHDKAQVIEGYTKTFEGMIRASTIR